MNDTEKLRNHSRMSSKYYAKCKTFFKVLAALVVFLIILKMYLSTYKIQKIHRKRIDKPVISSNKANDDTIMKNESNFLNVYVIPLTDEILDIHRRLNLTNPGYYGHAVALLPPLPDGIQAEIDKSNDEFKFNEFVSRLIPLDRELPDMRQGTCKSANYSDNLPKASIILAFYNEPFTMVMRTIYSILKRSPPDLIEEIILVDDCSDKESLLKPLHEVLPKLPKVRIIRSQSRLGLMKARVLGCVNARGPVLVVMDSHVEVATGWLPPLLDPIAKNHDVITLPGVETLKPQTLEYNNVITDKYPWVGGFTWKMMYTWTKLPKPNRSETPLPSPTMLGAAFAIRKDYFEYLGYYDSGFELWGGENMELSFKTWMCGGGMVQAFCSHVGHMYRARPYWDNSSDIKMIRNTDRLAEVWLDEYKIHYHKATKFNSRAFGDVSVQKTLRKKLGCKSFKWFVENIYTTLSIPVIV